MTNTTEYYEEYNNNKLIAEGIHAKHHYYSNNTIGT